MARFRSSTVAFPAVLTLPARVLRLALGLTVLASVVTLAGPPALTALGNYLVVEQAPVKADAIIVLSGDSRGRLEEGVRLFDEGYAPVLILTGAGQPGQPSAAEVMGRQADSMGVPPSAIYLEGQSRSTREDAIYTRKLMVQRGLRSAILVTSPYHGRRASLTFANAFQGSGITLTSCPVPGDRWSPSSWWTSSDTIRLTLNELLKLGYYQLNGYL